MNTIEHGDFKEEIEVEGSDEVADLTQTFNHMIVRIRTLIDNIYLARIRSTKARLDLLQAQINPHFLYNTLDTINWEAKRLKSRSISYMIEQLSDFIRLSLNSGNERTTIGMELQHIKAYFNLQKRRFGNAITLDINVPANLYSCECLNLLLQPLVENALLHGILEKEPIAGKVSVGSEIRNEMIGLWVEDDGAGIDPEKLEALLALLENADSTDSGSAFGLQNVQARVRLMYGETSGLTLASTSKGGVRATCVFPLVR